MYSGCNVTSNYDVTLTRKHSRALNEKVHLLYTETCNLCVVTEILCLIILVVLGIPCRIRKKEEHWERITCSCACTAHLKIAERIKKHPTGRNGTCHGYAYKRCYKGAREIRGSHRLGHTGWSRPFRRSIPVIEDAQ